MLVMSFSTDHWVEYIVQRNSIQETVSGSSKQRGLLGNNRHYYSRNRGLFQTCYHGNLSRFIGSLPEEDTNGNCVIDRGYEWSGTPRKDVGSWGKYYQIRKHCMRCQVIFMCLAMSIIAIAGIVGTVFCIGIGKEIRLINAKKFYVVTIMFVIVALLIAVSMILFHVIRDLERNKIWGEPFDHYWSGDQILQDHTRVVFGYSYIFAWVAFGFAIFSTFFFCITSIKLKHDEDFGNIDQKENLITETKYEAKYEEAVPTSATLYTGQSQTVPLYPIEQPILSPLSPFYANQCIFSVKPLPQMSKNSSYLDENPYSSKFNILNEETYATTIIRSSVAEQKKETISRPWPPIFSPLLKQRPPLPIPFKASSGPGDSGYATFISTNEIDKDDPPQDENKSQLYSIPDKKKGISAGAPTAWLYGDDSGTLVFEKEEESTKSYRISI